MSVTLDTIHDLETQIDELKTRSISLQASLDAAITELHREVEFSNKLVRERDYFKSFGVEIATRLNVVVEGVFAIQKAAELAGYKPSAVPSFKDAPAEQIDAALEKLGKVFGSNDAEPTQAVQEGGEAPLDKLS